MVTPTFPIDESLPAVNDTTQIIESIKTKALDFAQNLITPTITFEDGVGELLSFAGVLNKHPEDEITDAIIFLKQGIEQKYLSTQDRFISTDVMADTRFYLMLDIIRHAGSYDFIVSYNYLKQAFWHATLKGDKTWIKNLLRGAALETIPTNYNENPSIEKLIGWL